MSGIRDDSKLDDGDVFEEDINLLNRGLSGTENSLRWRDRKSCWTRPFSPKMTVTLAGRWYVSGLRWNVLEHHDRQLGQYGMDCWGWANVTKYVRRKYAKLDTDMRGPTTYCQMTERTFMTKLEWVNDATARTPCNTA